MVSEKPYKVHLQKEQETFLITLQAKALDNRSKQPILKDWMAEDLLEQIDYDFDKINGFGNDIMVFRAKQFDTWLNDS